MSPTNLLLGRFRIARFIILLRARARFGKSGTGKGTGTKEDAKNYLKKTVVEKFWI